MGGGSRGAVRLVAALWAGVGCASVFAGSALPPFDFSDQFYIANGIDPAGIIGRMDGTPPASIIDDTPNGPKFNNVRMLQHVAAYDHSGHIIFFSVPGVLSLDSFLGNSAGEEALEIADEFVVYEFPRAANPQGDVFPKRQELIADLSGGYFSNDPLGIWQVNIIKYTPAAFNTAEGQEMLAELAEDNGYDLDGTPLIRTKSEVEKLLDEGFATNFIPPADGSQGLRWFLCPVIEDPRDGAIAPDAVLLVTGGIPAAQEFIDEFNCLQQTGDWCDGGVVPPPCPADLTGNSAVDSQDLNALLSSFGSSGGGDIDGDGDTDSADLNMLLAAFGQGCG